MILPWMGVDLYSPPQGFTWAPFEAGEGGPEPEPTATFSRPRKDERVVFTPMVSVATPSSAIRSAWGTVRKGKR